MKFLTIVFKKMWALKVNNLDAYLLERELSVPHRQNSQSCIQAALPTNFGRIF
jgi:hypothetical protein